MLDLCGLAAVNQLIQRQQLLWAGPALEKQTTEKMFLEKKKRGVG